MYAPIKRVNTRNAMKKSNASLIKCAHLLCILNKSSDGKPVAKWAFESRLFAQRGLKWTLGATHHFSAQKTAFDSREKWFPAGLGVRRGGWWIEDGGCAPLSFYASERKASIDFFSPPICRPRWGNLRGKGFRRANRAAHAHVRAHATSLSS